MKHFSWQYSFEFYCLLVQRFHIRKDIFDFINNFRLLACQVVLVDALGTSKKG